jgi:hypothetical protein
MNEKLYIPKKINVGFQLRSDCYTGKLGYVIYWDDKGKLRKEASWQSWRQKPEDSPKTYNYKERKYNLGEPYGEKVAPIVLENLPVEGFVLNKDVGGVRSSYGWNDRIEKVRVFDPRGFEFEISVPNLLYILQECSSIKGKGLEGEFVYSWSGTELVLLPTNAAEYQKCIEFTDLQAKKLEKGELEAGYIYLDKNKEEATFVARDFFVYGNYDGSLSVSKENIFYKKCKYGDPTFAKSFKPVEKLGRDDNFANIVQKFKKTNHGSGIKEIQLNSPVRAEKRMYSYGCYDSFNTSYAMKEEGDGFHLYNLERYRGSTYKGFYKIKNGLLKKVSGEKREASIEEVIKEELKIPTFVLTDGTRYSNGEKAYEFNKKNKTN